MSQKKVFLKVKSENDVFILTINQISLRFDQLGFIPGNLSAA
jgi:hypothetical protein